MTTEPFNMRQWAEDHDRRDDERFGSINKIMGAAGLALLAVTGWSLVAQYTSMQKQVEQAQVQMTAIQQVRADVWRAAAATEETQPVPKRPDPR